MDQARRAAHAPSVKPVRQSGWAKLVGGGPVGGSIQTVLTKDSKGVSSNKTASDVVLVGGAPLTHGKFGAWVDLLDKLLEARNQGDDPRVGLMVLRISSNPRFIDIGLVL